MSDLHLIQPNSSYCYLSESMCALDVSNTLRYSNKTPTATIVGKKIISELKIPNNVEDKPPPFRVFIKKQRHDQSVSRSKKRQKNSKLKSCSDRKVTKS